MTDKEYLKIIKAAIDKTIAQYAILIYKVDNLKFVPKSEIQFVINEQLFLETLLMEIGGKTISYSAYKKKKNNDLETKLCEQIKELEYNDNRISKVLDEKQT